MEILKLSKNTSNSEVLEQARKLQATLVRNYRLLAYGRGWGLELLA